MLDHCIKPSGKLAGFRMLKIFSKSIQSVPNWFRGWADTGCSSPIKLSHSPRHDGLTYGASECHAMGIEGNLMVSGVQSSGMQQHFLKQWSRNRKISKLSQDSNFFQICQNKDSMNRKTRFSNKFENPE